MVVLQATIDIGNQVALDIFDNVTHMGFGTGTTTPTLADTVLETEVARTPLESMTKDVANNRYIFVGRLPLSQGNGEDISEIGLFTAGTGGTMPVRSLGHTNVTKTSDDELLYTLEVKVNTTN